MPAGYKVESTLMRRLVEPQREPHVTQSNGGIRLIKSKIPSRFFLRKLGGYLLMTFRGRDADHKYSNKKQQRY